MTSVSELLLLLPLTHYKSDAEEMKASPCGPHDVLTGRRSISIIHMPAREAGEFVTVYLSS